MAETRSSTSNSNGRFWLTLLAFVVGLIAIDLACAALIESKASMAYRQAIASKSSFQNEDAYGTWILGDSLAADGIVPSILEHETGRKTYNWGIYASSPFEWGILLRDLERRATFPKTVIIGCTPHMFIKRPNDGPFVPPAIRAPDLRLELMRGSVERADLSAILASGRKRLLLKGLIAQVVQKREVKPVRPVAYDNGFIRWQEGLSVSPRLMIDVLRFDERNARFQSKAFEEVVAQCAAHRVHVALVKLPIHSLQLSAYAEDEKSSRHYREMIAFVAGKYKCSVFEGQSEAYCATFGNSDFYDAIHLSNRGAIKFSIDLGHWLRVTWP